jgi:hypothetical protein
LIPLRVREPRVFIGCSDFEHGDKSANLTRIMKACSQNREDLEAWAREPWGAGSRGAEAACNVLGVCGGNGAAR